ncbi:MAG: energy transducer TonB [Ferruginibacter sp.]
MKIRSSFLLMIMLFVLQAGLHAQEIVNVVLVGQEGVTEDIKKATSFIVVKQYPANIYERLDYNMGKPLIKLRTYSDSLLKSQEGAQLEYYPSGSLQVKGNFSKNLKEDDWLYFNDTGKHILTETYKAGELIASKQPDTTTKKDSVVYGDEREANIKGGVKSWIKYIQKNLNADVAQSSVKGGHVRVLFKINTEGKTTEIYLKKSVEFVLDEEALRVIRDSPLWIPAFQNGRALNAYRIQPVTFVKE